ncbi:homeobox protein siamois-like [Eleutherodactylus coqui]|uniref:homeobox protein siamois-like n=1 Tax=Eleutherodactylus coqui TaxID=57060 RepID=UPI003463381A
MEHDPELDQVICNALSLQEDYPDLYLPPSDKDRNDSATFSKILLEMEIQRPLNDPNRLQDTLVEFYSILGIPQEPPVTRHFNMGIDQSVPYIASQDEQLARQQENGIKRFLSEEEMAISKTAKEEKEDHAPSASSQKCRKRTFYDKQQTLFLQKQFDCNPYPDYVSRCCFAQVTGIPEPRIQVWFQNRRARHLNKSSTSQEAGIDGSVGGKPLMHCDMSPNHAGCKNISAIHPAGPRAQTSKSNGHPR